jgi:predicted transglutaminase-like cysteine proteinase
MPFQRPGRGVLSMSAKARARHAAQWLPVLLFLGFITAAAVDTDATAASKIPAIANVAAGNASAIRPSVEGVPLTEAAQPERAPQQIVVASLATQTPPESNTVAAPTTTSSPTASIAPLISSAPARAPARIFTINEVMAKSAGRGSPNKLEGNIQLASVDPTATPDVFGHDKSNEPFGLLTLVAPDGLVWFKWRKVADDIRAGEPALMRCLADASQCSPATARFVAIVKEAREYDGRVRFNFVNQRVNNAIRYTSDMTQWSTPDEWSAPLAGGKGSFETGLGDCEDYAIAKYVALRAAGVSAKQLRVLLVHDNIAHLDHAVLAANDDGHWYVLDNRWTAAVEDSDVRRFTPLFALDDQGVNLLAVPYATRVEPNIEPMSEVVRVGKQKFLPGAEAADQLQPAQSGISALGLRPSIL